ncbi:MAG: FAD-dependent oxidoreductase, partial [Peptococcaceae bacterium]|nr:FAD-dependent oxidoreductase [Peptococcaceae bacterium]
MRYVIVGNSAAAAGCVEGIRSLDQAGEIAILSSEPYHIYSRPLISYLLLGKTDEERMRYRPADYYEVNGCRFLPGVTAQAVDPVKKEVATADGQRLPYDKLLLATGSKPFVPPMAGLETAPRRFSFLSLDDAKALRAALTPASRVLILGGGLIGLKCAEGISGQVASITVVDLAPQILPSILDQEAAAIVRAHVEGQGVSFRLGRSVQSFAGDQALLTDGESLTFDILVLAVGVRPNTDLAAAAGCQVERGLLIDGQGRTSVADIYGAGDCCQGWDITTDSSRVLALLPNAYAQGEAAGI